MWNERKWSVIFSFTFLYFIFFWSKPINEFFGKNFTNLYACSALCNKRVHTIVVCGIVTA